MGEKVLISSCRTEVKLNAIVYDVPCPLVRYMDTPTSCSNHVSCPIRSETSTHQLVYKQNISHAKVVFQFAIS